MAGGAPPLVTPTSQPRNGTGCRILPPRLTPAHPPKYLGDAEGDVADVEAPGLPRHLAAHHRHRRGGDGQTVRGHGGQQRRGRDLPRSWKTEGGGEGGTVRAGGEFGGGLGRGPGSGHTPCMALYCMGVMCSKPGGGTSQYLRIFFFFSWRGERLVGGGAQWGEMGG